MADLDFSSCSKVRIIAEALYGVSDKERVRILRAVGTLYDLDFACVSLRSLEPKEQADGG